MDTEFLKLQQEFTTIKGSQPSKENRLRLQSLSQATAALCVKREEELKKFKADPKFKFTKTIDENTELAALKEELDKLIQKGENLENLVSKADDLSFKSKAFRGNSRTRVAWLSGFCGCTLV